MPTVKVAGETFEIEATLGLLRRIKRVHGIDLLAKDVGGFTSFLNSSDSYWLVACEFLGLKTEADQDRIADKSRGSDIATVIHAITEALTDFFRESGDPGMVSAIQKVYQAAATARLELAKKIDEADVTEAIIHQMKSLDLNQDLADRMRGNQSGESPVG